MTLEQLRIFVAVAEMEHVTRASYALDMMQSAVSKSVAALEGETELRLFDRVERNIRLTVVGAAYRDHALELLEHARRLEAWAEASRPHYLKIELTISMRWVDKTNAARHRLDRRLRAVGQPHLLSRCLNYAVAQSAPWHEADTTASRVARPMIKAAMASVLIESQIVKVLMVSSMFI